MPSFAGITLIGHLGQDPQLKSVGQNEVCEFSIAVSNKRGKEETTNWYRVAVWGKQGQNCAQYLAKGQACAVVGELTVREYVKDGTQRYSLDVHADKVKFLGGNGERQPARTTPQNRTEYVGNGPQQYGEDEIPF